MNERIDIQNALYRLVRDVSFPRVYYDRETGLALPVNLQSAERVKPQSNIVNETISAFEVDPRFGRRRIERRMSWQFDLFLAFSVEVLLEPFEAGVLADPPTVPATNDHPQIMVDLTNVEYEHPVQQEPASGTRARYTFEAIQHRR